MKHSGQTVLWELWAALCLCTALVLPPGSPCIFGCRTDKKSEEKQKLCRK